MSKPKGKGKKLESGKFLCACERCGDNFEARYSTSKFCGAVCRMAVWKEENLEQHNAGARERARKHFANNTEYAQRQRESNKNYKKANRARCSERQRLREAGRLASAEEALDRDIIYSFFMGTCGICGEQMDYNDFHVDHIIPLSKDGPHIYDNVQATHPLCNNKKYDKVDYAIL